MAGERDGIIEAGPSNLSHVSGIQKEEEILGILSDISHGSNNDSLILLSGIWLWNKYSFCWMAKLITSPSHLKAKLFEILSHIAQMIFCKTYSSTSFHINFSDSIGKRSPVDRLKPPSNVGKSIRSAHRLGIDAGVFPTLLRDNKVSVQNNHPIISLSGNGRISNAGVKAKGVKVVVSHDNTCKMIDVEHVSHREIKVATRNFRRYSSSTELDTRGWGHNMVQ